MEDQTEKHTLDNSSLQSVGGKAPASLQVTAKSASDWGAVRLLMNENWLRNSLNLSLFFAPQCILPAVILTVGGLAMTAGQYAGLSQMQMQKEFVQMSNLLTALGILLTTCLVVLVCFVWAFALWLVRLSTYSHAFNQLNMCAEKLPETEELKAIFSSSHKFILSRKKYFARFYLLVSLVMLAPVITCMTLISIKIYSAAPATDALVPKISLPAGADALITISVAVLGIYLIGLSMISVVVSSISKDNANVAAWDCIKLSFAKFFPITVLVIVVAIMNTVIATPQICLHPMDTFSLANTRESLPVSLVSELWEGITSVMLFTLTLAPFCELFRSRYKSFHES